MRDYSNLPHVQWEHENSVYMARAQVEREEPLIIDMPEGFELEVDGEACGCTWHEETGIFINCDPEPTLGGLARRNGSEDMSQLAEVTREMGLTVDVDRNGKRLIIHD